MVPKSILLKFYQDTEAVFRFINHLIRSLHPYNASRASLGHQQEGLSIFIFAQ